MVIEEKTYRCKVCRFVYTTYMGATDCEKKHESDKVLLRSCYIIGDDLKTLFVPVKVTGEFVSGHLIDEEGCLDRNTFRISSLDLGHEAPPEFISEKLQHAEESVDRIVSEVRHKLMENINTILECIQEREW